MDHTDSESDPGASGSDPGEHTPDIGDGAEHPKTLEQSLREIHDLLTPESSSPQPPADASPAPDSSATDTPSPTAEQAPPAPATPTLAAPQEPDPDSAAVGAAPITEPTSARSDEMTDSIETTPASPPPAATPTDRPPRQPRLRRWPIVVLALLSGLFGAAAAVGYLFVAGAFDDEAAPSTTPVTTTIPVTTTTITIQDATSRTDGGTDAAAVGRKVVPSIVTVEIGYEASAGFELYGSGSGVVLSADGYIVTNHHVVEDSDLARVVFQDGRIYSADIVGSDARTDLAVLTIAANGLSPIEIGATDTMEIGNVAIAIGNPLGLRGGASLTVGVLSAFDREVITGSGYDPNDTLFGMLQTDAPIQQGSSGGALVDGTGRLIGITTAIGVSSAGAEGIGFAIPIELVTRITDEIIETGSVRHAFLGVSLQNSYAEAADGAQVPSGAIIIGFAGTPSAAEAAGLEIGDIIVDYNGTNVADREQLISGLRRLEVGDVVSIEVKRGDEHLTFDVTLGERPPDQ